MHTYFIHPDEALRVAHQHISEQHRDARQEELARMVEPRRITRIRRMLTSAHRLPATVDSNPLTGDVPCIAGT
jgi:hypothetical protein